MGYLFFRSGSLLNPAEKFRREHERWINRAISTGANLPRIPTRAVDEGGFSALMASREGQEEARRWWTWAFEMTDLD